MCHVRGHLVLTSPVKWGIVQREATLIIGPGCCVDIKLQFFPFHHSAHWTETYHMDKEITIYDTEIQDGGGSTNKFNEASCFRRYSVRCRSCKRCWTMQTVERKILQVETVILMWGEWLKPTPSTFDGGRCRWRWQSKFINPKVTSYSESAESDAEPTNKIKLWLYQIIAKGLTKKHAKYLGDISINEWVLCILVNLP